MIRLIQKIDILALTLLAALMLASCSKEEEAVVPIDSVTPGDTSIPDGDIRFEIGFEPLNDAGQPDAQTRVATDASFRSTWENGDQIGIYAVEHDNALAATADGNVFHNVRLTYSSATGEWKADEPLYWPKDGTKLDFYAYYPYNPAATNPTAISFSGMAYQIDVMPHLLWAKNNNKGEGYDCHQNVVLNFVHKMAMIELRVKNCYASGLNVQLTGCSTSHTLSLSDGALSSPTSPETIQMARCSRTDGKKSIVVFRALVSPQEIDLGTVMFNMAIDDFKYASSPLASSVPLSQGRAEIFEQNFPFTLVSPSDGVRLTELMTDAEFAEITHLRVIGHMQAVDFYAIRDKMTALEKLDMSKMTQSSLSIPDSAFVDKTSLKELLFSEKTKKIGERAFAGCEGLTGTLKLPDNVTSIGIGAFEDCSGLTGSLTIPGNIENIDDNTFNDCGFNDALTIPKGVKRIRYGAFEGCKFTGPLVLPEGLKYIGHGAFRGGLDDVALTIPSSVETIRSEAFWYCFFSSITCYIPDPTAIECDKSVFDNGNDEMVTDQLYVPKSAVELYQNTPPWSKISKIEAIPETP